MDFLRGIVGWCVLAGALVCLAPACEKKKEEGTSEKAAAESAEKAEQTSEKTGAVAEKESSGESEESGEEKVEGGPMPELAATNLAGEAVTLKPDAEATLVNLWATWCAPCIAEMPLLAKVGDKWKPEGLRMIGISVEGKKSREKIEKFVDEGDVPFEVWYAPEKNPLDVLGDSSVPASFLYDGDGKLVWSHASMLEEKHADGLHAAIGKLLD